MSKRDAVMSHMIINNRTLRVDGVVRQALLRELGVIEVPASDGYFWRITPYGKRVNKLLFELFSKDKRPIVDGYFDEYREIPIYQGTAPIHDGYVTLPHLVVSDGDVQNKLYVFWQAKEYYETMTKLGLTSLMTKMPPQLNIEEVSTATDYKHNDVLVISKTGEVRELITERSAFVPVPSDAIIIVSRYEYSTEELGSGVDKKCWVTDSVHLQDYGDTIKSWLDNLTSSRKRHFSGGKRKVI